MIESLIYLARKAISRIRTASNDFFNEPVPDKNKPSCMRPHYLRKRQLNRAITEAWNSDFCTYEQITDYVRRKTGKGCSRRAITDWKRQHGFII
ncbi:MAG: hypothetical protein ACLFTJ_02520 [Halothece sp.]